MKVVSYLCTGTFYVDPNMGCNKDAFKVHCEFEGDMWKTCFNAKEATVIMDRSWNYTREQDYEHRSVSVCVCVALRGVCVCNCMLCCVV